MSFLNALCRGAIPSRPRSTASPLRLLNARPSGTASRLATVRSNGQPATRTAVLCRHGSTGAAIARQKGIAYPERINVYRSGTSALMAVGMTRVATILIMVIGSVMYAPAFYYSPDHNNLWVPAFVIASAVPFTVTALATGPMIHAIRVYLPSRARRSKVDLKYFVTHTPGETILELQYMRWLPWPQTRRVAFDRLRRLQPSLRGGIANLEQQSEAPVQQQKSFLGWLVHRNMGRFYVNRAQRNDRSAVPGVWEGMWHQIPWKGAKEDRLMSSAKKEAVPRR